MEDKISANEIFFLLFNANTVEVMELAQAAHRKWCRVYKDSPDYGRMTSFSGTMLHRLELFLQNIESQGLDCAQVMAQREQELMQETFAKFYTEDEGEATLADYDAIRTQWQNEVVETVRKREKVIRKARLFLSEG